LNQSSSAYYYPHCGAQAFLMDLPTRSTGHNPPRGPSADWWVLTTTNAVGTNGLKCTPKHGGAPDSKFWVTHTMTDQCCLAYAIVCRAHRLQGHRVFESVIFFNKLRVYLQHCHTISKSYVWEWLFQSALPTKTKNLRNMEVYLGTNSLWKVSRLWNNMTCI
jgi:hypothetical protein